MADYRQMVWYDNLYPWTEGKSFHNFNPAMSPRRLSSKLFTRTTAQEQAMFNAKEHYKGSAAMYRTQMVLWVGPEPKPSEYREHLLINRLFLPTS
ncbi:unnamed protein product [Clavelina lepadiformis]|uniref:Uncharacterized protein n=1 Tax=Clavelina lepadiformis TaxID=159417 RepID=A0ABP0G1W1_CLALP